MAYFREINWIDKLILPEVVTIKASFIIDMELWVLLGSRAPPAGRFENSRHNV
jgi:hypothetical protein